MNSQAVQRLRLPWLTLSLVALLALGHLLGFPHREHLWLDLTQPMELWRWATGQWLHTSHLHAAMNALALLGFGTIVEQHERSLVPLGLLLGMTAVGLWFFLMNDRDLYLGLSGALSTLLVMGLGLAGIEAFRSKDRALLVALALTALGFAAYLITELLLGQRWFAVSDWPSAPGAHASGCLAGLGWWAFRWYRQPD